MSHKSEFEFFRCIAFRKLGWAALFLAANSSAWADGKNAASAVSEDIYRTETRIGADTIFFVDQDDAKAYGLQLRLNSEIENVDGSQQLFTGSLGATNRGMLGKLEWENRGQPRQVLGSNLRITRVTRYDSTPAASNNSLVLPEYGLNLQDMTGTNSLTVLLPLVSHSDYLSDGKGNVDGNAIGPRGKYQFKWNCLTLGTEGEALWFFGGNRKPVSSATLVDNETEVVKTTVTGMKDGGGLYFGAELNARCDFKVHGKNAYVRAASIYQGHTYEAKTIIGSHESVIGTQEVNPGAITTYVGAGMAF